VKAAFAIGFAWQRDEQRRRIAPARLRKLLEQLAPFSATTTTRTGLRRVWLSGKFLYRRGLESGG